MKLSSRFLTLSLMLAFLLSLSGLVYVLLYTTRGPGRWESAPGHVESSRILVITPEGHPDHTRWEPYVQYLYTVNGELYHSDRVFAVQSGLPGDHSSAEDITRRFPAGKPIVVFYNPREPAMSVLVRDGDTSIGAGQFILGALSTLFGWALLDRLIRRRHALRQTGRQHA
ncbi:DUF3592 domain-containing protein [uncultured Aquitalea sp.]|uniref:DUF3592 domain-containing protein n=1 Tax=uncultured Aquitalea sp. TaxID=540272 RepID=UPI0025ED3E2F|nr:DUF3592 domain-containing protein [uncultured Aquitalea sp.]